MPSETAWPPPSGLTTSVVPRKDAVLEIHSSTKINAPARTVFDIILRIDNYDKWNTWMPNAHIIEQGPTGSSGVDANDSNLIRKGTIMNFAVIMDAKKPEKTTDTRLLVTDLSTPENSTEYVGKDVLENDGTFTADLSKVYRVAWTTHGGFVARGLKSERFTEVIVTGENECEVRSWEVMGGMLAYTVKWMFQATLKEKFQLWASDLKKWSEKKHQEGSGASE